jgi:hypothetical protein
MHPIQTEEYPLLHLFKKEVEVDKHSPKNKPYTHHKASILIYRTIFLTIGITYFILASIIYSKSLYWTCALIFGSSIAVKSVLLMVCGFISFISFIIGYYITPEKESVKHIVRNAKKKIKQIYRYKMRHTLPGIIIISEEQKLRAAALNQELDHAMETLHRYQEEGFHLVAQIAKTNSLDNDQKEELFNQAMIELRIKLERLIQSTDS